MVDKKITKVQKKKEDIIDNGFFMRFVLTDDRPIRDDFQFYIKNIFHNE